MQTIWAEQALTKVGWKRDVRVCIDDGHIVSVEPGRPKEGHITGVLLPAPANVHSHAFQRAMAGLTERRCPGTADSFWTWRKLMFAFLDRLDPDDAEAIAAFVQMEMLEVGYAAVGEFHYLHHRPGGIPYDDIGEMAARISAAAEETGIGLTLLPVLYQHGGCDGRPLGAGQIRFGNTPNQFASLVERAHSIVDALPDDSRLGIAPHSLRAVDREGLDAAIALADVNPIHIHLAEQMAEVEEVLAFHGARPAEWLMANCPVAENWCAIHCTQMEPPETTALAATGAVAGLCPITESSLGDGIFDGRRYVSAGGDFAIGSDSNIRISLAEELRTLEYSQRLQNRQRAVFAEPERSTGCVLFEGAVKGGAQAIGRDSGALAPGMLADLLALDMTTVDLEGRFGDLILDAFIFAGDDRMVTDTWSAGRHMVRQGRHVRREAIEARYRKTLRRLRDAVR